MISGSLDRRAKVFACGSVTGHRSGYGTAQRCRDRAAAIGESRHGPETHTPVRMMVRPAISFSSLQAWTRRGAT